MPTAIIPAISTLAKSVAKANTEADKSRIISKQAKTAVAAVAEQVISQHIKTGKAFMAAEKRHKGTLEELYGGENLSPSGVKGNRISMSYPQASKYKKIAKYPFQAKLAAREIGSYDTKVIYPALSNATPEAEEDAMLALSPPKKDNHRAIGTGENEWYTPAKYIEMVRKLFGAIDLDPASSTLANETVQATLYFTEEDNGLERDWLGAVWLNPPYSQPHIYNFVEKLVSEYAVGNVDEAVMLTHSYTDTRWFQLAAKYCTAVCFTTGRIAFESPTGEKAAPTQGQAFLYFGDNTEEFARLFSEIGFVIYPYRT